MNLSPMTKTQIRPAAVPAQRVRVTGGTSTSPRPISSDRLETVLVCLVALPALVALDFLFLAWAIGLL